MFLIIQEAMESYLTAFAQWLCAADFARGPVDEVTTLEMQTIFKPRRLYIPLG